MLLRIVGPRPVVLVEVRLVGDGRPWQQMASSDGRALAGIWFTTQSAGAWWVQVQVTDDAGCQDTTGVRRAVTVR